MSDNAFNAKIGELGLHPETAPLGTISDAHPVADTIGKIIDPGGTPLEVRESPLSASEMGHTPTPDYWAII